MVLILLDPHTYMLQIEANAVSHFITWKIQVQNSKVSFKGNTFKHVGNKIETSFEGEFLNTETDTGKWSERKVILY